MAWSYSGDPSTDDKDHVRFLIGDTYSGDPLVSDEEIAFALTDESTSVYRAAAKVARHIAAFFRRNVSYSMEGTAIQAQQRSEQFAALAEELEKRADKETVPASGNAGIIADLPVYPESVAIFDIAMHDNTTRD